MAFALSALGAIAGALALIFYASFPYWFAESGSDRFAREHRLDGFLALLGAFALVWVAWRCMRRSLASRSSKVSD